MWFVFALHGVLVFMVYRKEAYSKPSERSKELLRNKTITRNSILDV